MKQGIRGRILRCMRLAGAIGGAGLVLCGVWWVSPLDAQSEQVMEVTIKDNTFVTKQIPLALDVPIRINVKNEDKIRHDFGSTIFQDTLTHVDHDGVIAYGKAVGGVFLDGGKHATVQFTLHRPGQYQFKCSIHPNMRGEILLMSVGAV